MLGHHREDSLETFFMNLFHGGKLAAMPAKLLNDEGDVEVLRAADLAVPSRTWPSSPSTCSSPIIPCDLCGSREGLERNAMKAMLDDIERRMPGRKDVMIRALGNIRPSHMLDPKLFDFLGSWPMNIDISTLANVLRDAAKAEIVPRFRRLDAGMVSQKTEAIDLVTEADVEAEKRITARIAQLWPGAVVVGEEAVAADPGLLSALPGADLAITLDPVDGTANFAAGLPLFAVMAAV